MSTHKKIALAFALLAATFLSMTGWYLLADQPGPKCCSADTCAKEHHHGR